MWGQAEEELPIDRHHDFASTVSLAGKRFNVGRRDLGWSGTMSTEFPSTSCMSKDRSGSTVLPGLGKRGTAMASTISGTRESKSTRLGSKRSPFVRKAPTWGVRIRENTLPRQDPIPVRLSGRRHGAAPDDRIQVWVRVPKGKLAFWVPPNLPLGPASAQVEESTCGRDTPLRRLLTQLNEESFVDEKELRSANFEMASQEHVQSTAKLSGPTVSQMSPTLSSTTLSDVESSFKSLIQAATGVPMSQQKLFFGPSGLLEDNSKALFQYEIGQGAMVHLSTRRDPELVAQFYEDARRSKRKGKKTYHGLENPRHLLDNRIFDRIRQFMNTKVGSKMGKDLVMIVPDWKKAGVVPLEYEWPHEQPWHDYKLMPDNGIFDFAGRIRKKFHLLPRLAGAAASPKLIEAHAVSMQRTGILSNDASPRADDG
ncbi:unnamed protein product [Durusdinium trenchii]|uniref:Ubiquitin-like domain-containing protein n=1 Tax=Durusdinium trenchii TaxID=1381693 RepID=A0ABP0SY32_9DINO